MDEAHAQLDQLYINLVEDLRAELESWKRTCASRDQKIDGLEKEVATKAKTLDDLEEACISYKRAYTTQVQLKGMANSRAAMAEQEVQRLGHKLDANRALVEKLAEDVILRDEAIEATRATLLKQVDDWKEAAEGTLREMERWRESSLEAEECAARWEQEAEDLYAKIDHLEAQRAAWHSEVSRLEKVEEESWGDKMSAEEGNEIIGELAGALAYLLDEPLEPCKSAACAGHNGPKAHQAIKDAQQWADEKRRELKAQYERSGRQAETIRAQRDVIRRLKRQAQFSAQAAGDRSFLQQQDHLLVAALRDRIEELEDVAVFVFNAPSSGAEGLWKRASWALRRVDGRHAWPPPQPFWSERLLRDFRVMSPAGDLYPVWVAVHGRRGDGPWQIPQAITRTR